MEVTDSSQKPAEVGIMDDVSTGKKNDSDRMFAGLSWLTRAVDTALSFFRGAGDSSAELDAEQRLPCQAAGSHAQARGAMCTPSVLTVLEHCGHHFKLAEGDTASSVPAYHIPCEPAMICLCFAFGL